MESSAEVKTSDAAGDPTKCSSDEMEDCRKPSSEHHESSEGHVVLSETTSVLSKVDGKFSDFAVFWHGDCYEHKIKHHIEQPDRVAAILSSLQEYYPKECFREAPLVTMSQILSYHTQAHLSYLDHLFSASENAHADGDDEEMIQTIDGDTKVMWKTRKAVFRAAGAAVAAVDALYLPIGDAGKISSAFCCVRPPGHHAWRGRAGGFCFLCNAGIAAKHAQKEYGVGKVAVLDFDVHHGDGVEDGFTPDPTLFYGSTHEKDNFPMTGDDPTPYIGARARNPVHRRIVNRTLPRGPVSVSVFRTKWVEIIEEMVLFKPDLVIFCAGFDAHDEDPLASVELTEEDFAWATETVMKACLRVDPTNPAPLLSVLEGGYDLDALSDSALAHCNVLSSGYSSLRSAVQATIEGENVEVEVEVGVEKGYGGDEVAALDAYIKKMKLV